MKLFELEQQLNNLKLKYRNYNLIGRYLEDGYCLSEDNNIWEVYYCERGEKHVIGMFTNENDACEYMFCIFKKKADKERWF